jgi:hypothetical protein
MNKVEFLNKFDEIASEDNIMVVYVENEDMQDTEEITFGAKDFDYKRNYYDTTYNSEMVKNSNSKIRIVKII